MRILMELPQKVPIKIRRIATGVKPTFSSATVMTPIKIRARIATSKISRIAKTAKLLGK
jgi:hypothetical protein